MAPSTRYDRKPYNSVWKFYSQMVFNLFYEYLLKTIFFSQYNIYNIPPLTNKNFLNVEKQASETILVQKK